MRPGTLTTRERDPRRKALTGSCMRDTRNEQAGRSQVGRHPPSRQWHLPTSTSAPSHLNARNRNCGKWELGAVLAAAAAPQFANIARLQVMEQHSAGVVSQIADPHTKPFTTLQLLCNPSFFLHSFFFSTGFDDDNDDSVEGWKEGRREGPLVKAFATPAAA